MKKLECTLLSDLKLQNGEEIIFKCQPTKSLIIYLGLAYAIALPVVLVTFYYLFRGFYQPSQNFYFQVTYLMLSHPIYLVASTAATLLIAVIIKMRQLKKLYYIFTNKRVMIDTQSSSIFALNRAIYYLDITNVSISDNPIKRLFGFTTVLLLRSKKVLNGHIAKPIPIQGVNQDQARKIKSIISEYTAQSR